MTDYHVAVPSYRRAETLRDKTLPTLINGGVPASAITVYLHEYDPTLDDYFQVCGQYQVGAQITAARGIFEQRQRIADYYPVGAEIVQVDDDLSGYKALDAQGKPRNLDDVGGMFERGFRLCRQEGLYTWGVQPNDDGRAMRPGHTTRLVFLIGQTYGYINRPGHPSQLLTVPCKGDYEHTLRHFKYDGGIVRMRDVAPRSKVYAGGGGLNAPGPSQRDYRTSLAATRQLMEQYPQWVRRKPDRNGWPEIALTPVERRKVTQRPG